MANHLELQVSCLAGGTILEIHSLDEAERAEAWGAVATYFPVLDVLSGNDLDRLVEGVSLHPVCEPDDFARLDSAYESRTPNHFAHLAAADLSSHPRSFVSATTPAEIERFIRANVLLLVCSQPSLLPHALERRAKLSAPTLLFVACSNVEEGDQAFRNGAHGIFLRRPKGSAFPSEEDQRRLMHSVIEAPAEVWPRNRQVIGVLAHQGDYLAHLAAMQSAIRAKGLDSKVAVREVRTRHDYDRCSAIILPGGWSNLQTLFLEETGIDRALRAAKESGLPTLGTCAGMILAGSRCGNCTPGRAMLGLMPGTIDNNVVDGMTAIQWSNCNRQDEILFSNGPILKDPGRGVVVLATTFDKGLIVAARHEATFVYSFHAYERTHPEFLDFCLASWK